LPTTSAEQEAAAPEEIKRERRPQIKRIGPTIERKYCLLGSPSEKETDLLKQRQKSARIEKPTGGRKRKQRSGMGPAEQKKRSVEPWNRKYPGDPWGNKGRGRLTSNRGSSRSPQTKASEPKRVSTLVGKSSKGTSGRQPDELRPTKKQRKERK